MNLNPSERDVMRDMTPQELLFWYRFRLWPCCYADANEHETGPRGGASVNLKCHRCDMRINVMDPLGPHGNVPLMGQVIREPMPRPTLSPGDIATVWHNGTGRLYRATIIGPGKDEHDDD